jgi:quinol-cytochrome oxidoreductase complex cytochrome b subunit
MLIIIQSHILSYPSSNNIYYLWNIGFILILLLVTQILTGILLSCNYISDIQNAYSSVMYINRDIYIGWYFHYTHSSIVSVFMLLIYIHIGRALYYNSFKLNNTLDVSSIVILWVLIVIAFMGYVLTWGQISFWGVTVIKNICSCIPCLIEWLCGSFYVCNPTLIRFFILHFILPFTILGLIIIHISYCHYISSSNPLCIYSSWHIPLYPCIILKDMFCYLMVYVVYIFQVWLLIILCSHPDNSIEVNLVVTPVHIVPEWYLLCLYVVLKGIPNINSGFLMLLICILLMYQMCEVKNVSSISRLTSYICINTNVFIIYLFILIWCDVCIGAQLPQDMFLSSGRIFLVYKCVILISDIWCYLGSSFNTNNLSNIDETRDNE